MKVLTRDTFSYPQEWRQLAQWAGVQRQWGQAGSLALLPIPLGLSVKLYELSQHPKRAVTEVLENVDRAIDGVCGSRVIHLGKADSYLKYIHTNTCIHTYIHVYTYIAS